MTNQDLDIDNQSAFALRAALKQSQIEVAHERLFEKLGQQLFEHGWSEALLQWLLDELCLASGAVHGLIAEQHAGALKILAQRGKTYPVGARVPMMGVLASWLKEPVRFQIHTQPINHLWSLSASGDAAEPPLFFNHAAVACQHRAIGLIGLATSNPLNERFVSTLHSVCGLLGLALQQINAGSRLREDSNMQLLTPREREVFALLPSGASNAALAEKLGISPGTVKIHVERILNKLAVKDRTQAAVKAVEAGFSSEGL